MASSSHRSRNNPKTAVTINVYDLLPVSPTPAPCLAASSDGSFQPGKISSLLWVFGCGLLHTGVVVNGREYAFGGHDRKGITGVYWMTPRTEPPGGTFRCEVLHGFSFGTEEEINRAILQVCVSQEGRAVDLQLVANCV